MKFKNNNVKGVFPEVRTTATIMTITTTVNTATALNH